MMVRESNLSMARAYFISFLVVAAVLRAQQPVYWNNGAKIPIYGIGLSAATNVAVDAPEVRKLISEEEKRQDEAERFYREKHTADEKLRHMMI